MAAARPPRLRFLLAAAALILLPIACAGADPDRLHTGKTEEDNYEMKVPATWAWGPASDYEKYGAKERAERLAKVKKPDGTETDAEGYGGRVLLTLQPVPKEVDADYETWLRDWMAMVEESRLQADPNTGNVPPEIQGKVEAAREKIEKALAALGGLASVQDLLLSRFKGAKPKLEIDAHAVFIGGVPAVKVTAEEKAANLAGQEADCEARMFVWVIRKKMYRLVIWLWPAKGLTVGLRTEADIIEGLFAIPKTTPIPKRDAPPAATLGGGDDDKVEGDSAEEKDVKDLARGVKVKKLKRFASKSMDRSKPVERDMVFEFYAHDRVGSEAFLSMMAYPVQSGLTGFKIDSYLAKLWPDFVAVHPKGPLKVMPFPPVAPKTPFLSMPDFAKAKEQARPQNDKDGKPEAPSKGDMDRLGILEEAKDVKLSGDKVRFCWRCAYYGSLERIGDDFQVKWMFSTPEYSYVVYATFRKDGLKIFGPDVTTMLGTIALVEAPKTPGGGSKPSGGK